MSDPSDSPTAAFLPERLCKDPSIDAMALGIYAFLRMARGIPFRQRTLCRVFCCSRPTFRDRRDRLAEAGWLTWERSSNGRTRYTVRLGSEEGS